MTSNEDNVNTNEDIFYIFMEKFADRLKKSIINKGLNVSSFSKEIEVSRSAVNLYLKGERIPDAEFVLKSCQILNVSSDWLIGLSDVSSFSETDTLSKNIEFMKNVYETVKDVEYSERRNNPLAPDEFKHVVDLIVKYVALELKDRSGKNIDSVLKDTVNNLIVLKAS